MSDKKVVTPDAVYRVWESAQDLIELSSWLPEVVGTSEELTRLGTIKMIPLPVSIETDEVMDSNATPVLVEAPQEGQLFIDADVSKYRRWLSMFRQKKHKVR